MQAFHNDPDIKAKYCARVAAHIAADELIHGVGWEDGKGCAIGCIFHNYDHALGPTKLGLPEWLMRLVDVIFEGLPNTESRDFVSRFLQVIPVGANVELVKHQLAIRRIDRLCELQRRALRKNHGNVKRTLAQMITALEAVRRCHEDEIEDNPCDWSAARLAAWAAWAAQLEPESAAKSAAKSEAWKQEAADLLELLAATAPEV